MPEIAKTPLEALQELVAYLQDGNAGKNPYSIPEVVQALNSIKQTTGFRGHAYDANNVAYEARKNRKLA